MSGVRVSQPVQNLFVEKMKIVNYFKESYSELIHKVSWPTLKELTNSAVIVLVASLLIALVVWVMDISFETIMKFVYEALI